MGDARQKEFYRLDFLDVLRFVHFDLFLNCVITKEGSTKGQLLLCTECMYMLYVPEITT